MLGPLLKPVARFPAAHWHGQHSLVVTLLVTVVGVYVLASYLLPLISDMRGPLVIGGWVVVNGAILVWQLVGTWRATENHLALPTDTVAAWGGYFTMLVAGVLAVLQTIDGVSTFAPAPPREAAPAIAIEPPVSADGRIITLAGDLSFDLNAAFELALERHADLRRVVLDSAGGNIFAARAIGLNITKRQLDTYVAGNCYSACTLVFMAGQQRTIAPSGQLGFHQYSIPGALRVKVLDVSAEQTRDSVYFASRGVTDDFLKQVFSARHSNLWRPDHATLYAGGVLTAR